MKSERKRKVYDLLKAIETGDPKGVEVVNESQYIQHNPQTQEGSEGLAQLFARLAKTNPKVDIVRLFEDGDFVFGHTIYDFATVRIGFEVFRYEGDQIVEHWDNIQPRSGDMVAGATDIEDLDQTESNRTLIQRYLEQVFINKNKDLQSEFIDSGGYIERSTFMHLKDKSRAMDYEKTHRILAEGNFVLSVNEGQNQGEHYSFYDLFRLKNGMIVEHWDTSEKVPHKSEWKNDNGKF